MVDSSCKYFFKVIVAQAGSACKESRPFLRKKRTAPGRSFSLYLMRTVKAHGGTMTAENLDSGGACFRFYLPLEEGINSEIEG